METYIVDSIVKNVLFKKKSISSQLNKLQRLFDKAFLNIDEKTILDRIKVITAYKQTLSNLRKIPIVEQRSPEWYDIRKSLITASDFAQAVKKGKFGSQKKFYAKKCGYEKDEFDSSIPPLQWGVRYEEVANMFYKLKYDVDVYEFGVLKHPSYDFLGASPDGISSLGIMLEIKCPYRRKCTESIPEQYEYQIQGQLEVCDLEECDYLECYIEEYEDYDAMMNDTSCKYKGQIWVLPGGQYEYGNLNEFFRDKSCPCYHYGIKSYFIKRVRRDRKFFGELVVQLQDVWKQVLRYRENKSVYDKEIGSSENSKVEKARPYMFLIDDEGDVCI